MKSKNFWILDTETTGFDEKTGDRIIEIGAIEVDENKKETGRRFHEYVDPEREIPEAAVKVHGLTRDDCIQLGNGQKFKDVAEKLFDCIKDSTIIIHNVDFDLRFLNNEFELLNKKERRGKGRLEDYDATRAKYPPLSNVCDFFCTLKFAGAKFPGQRNNLDILCRRFGIKNENRELHGALLDCTLLLQVWRLLTQHQKIIDFNPASTIQDANKLAELIESKYEMPMYSSGIVDESEHKRIMERVIKESFGKAVWDI